MFHSINNPMEDNTLPVSVTVPRTINPASSSPKEQRLEDIQNQCSVLISELDTNINPEAIVKKHIASLEKYTDLKDIALGLVTMIADQRHLRTTDILEEMKAELENKET